MAGEATRFEKGRSGNPGGKPKGLERQFREQILAKREAGDVDGLTAIIDRIYERALGRTGGSEKEQTEATKVVLSYVIGKPQESITHDFATSPEQLAILAALRLTPPERAKRLAEIDADPPLDATDPDV